MRSSIPRFDNGFGTGMLRRGTPAAPSQWDSSEDTAMVDASAPDEFEREFEQPHRLAHQQQSTRGRNMGRRAEDRATDAFQDGRGGAAAVPAASAGFDAPPTSSLSAMLAATQSHSRSSSLSTGGFPYFDARPKASSSGAMPLGLSSRSSLSLSLSGVPLSSGVSAAGASSAHAGVDVPRAFAHFASQMQTQHQFDYLAWSHSVRHWRTVAAGVWYAGALLVLLYVLGLSYTSVWPGWRSLGWGWSVAFTSVSALTQWPSTLMFLGAQVALLWVRAHAARTDPSPLHESAWQRVRRCITQTRQVSMLGCNFVGVLFAGWNLMHVLLSSLWTPPAAGAAVTSRAGADFAFVVTGLFCYAALHSALYVYRLENLLRFPLLRHQGRLRSLMQVVPGVLLSAAAFAAKFVIAFTMLVWSVAGAAMVPSASSGATDAASDEVLTAVQVPSMLSLSALPALYHLFVLVLSLHVSASLCRVFLDVFLTQPLSFHNYFLHALYETRGISGAEGAASAMSLVDEADGADSATSAAPPALPSLLRSLSSADYLTSHLVLQYLLDLSSVPSLTAQRNRALFQPDMNVLFAVGPDSIMLMQTPAAKQPQPSSQTVPAALRSTLPPQPAFVPVMLYCMRQLRLLTDALTAQRTLAQSAPSAAIEWQAAQQQQHMGVSSSAAVSAAGIPFSSAVASSVSAPPPSPELAWLAFVSTQLDGGGLLYPSKSQLCGALMAHVRHAGMCAQIVAALAVHAHAEAHAEDRMAAATTGDALHTDALLRARSLPAGAQLPSSPQVRSSASLLCRQWAEPTATLLLSLLLSLEAYVHAPHFVGRAQEHALEGHQLNREACATLEGVVSLSLQRLVACYSSDVCDWNLSPPLAAKLQAYVGVTR